MPDAITTGRTDQSQLQQIVAAIDDGVIIVRPDHAIAWANRAALEMHGVRTVAELADVVRDYRSRFAQQERNRKHANQAAADAGEAACAEITVSVHRPGQASRPTHQVQRLLLNVSADAPPCVALVVKDVTEQVSAEERFESTFGANPAPAIICRLNDLRFIKVNQGFLDMTGYRADAVLGRTVYDLDVLEDAHGRERAVRLLQHGETIPQREAYLRLPDGRRKCVIVAGHPIAIGDTACMLFTFVDIDDRKQAEEQFRLAFSLAPGPMAVIELSGFRLLRVNEAFVAATGWQPKEVLGQSVEELKLWEHGDTRMTIKQRLRHEQRLRSIEVMLRRKDGSLAHYLLSAENVTLADQECVLSVMQDISERKRTETELMEAIKAVMQDTSWFSQKIIEKLTNLGHPSRLGASSAALADLSERETEVLSLLAQGLSDADITTKLGVSRNTVRNHVSRIYRKTGVHGRGAAVVWARERGFLDGDPIRPARTRRRPE